MIFRRISCDHPFLEPAIICTANLGRPKIDVKCVFDKINLAPLKKIIYQISGNYRILMIFSVFIYQRMIFIRHYLFYFKTFSFFLGHLILTPPYVGGVTFFLKTKDLSRADEFWAILLLSYERKNIDRYLFCLKGRGP